MDERRSARSRHEIGTDTVPEQASADGTDALLDAWLVSDALNELSAEHRLVIVHAYYRGSRPLRCPGSCRSRKAR